MKDSGSSRAADPGSVKPSRQALADLLARVEAAEGPDREIDLDLILALGLGPSGDGWERRRGKYDQGGRPELRQNLAPQPGPWPIFCARPYTASLDAALALVKRVLGDVKVRVTTYRKGGGRAEILADGERYDIANEQGACPALAVVAALLKALIASELTPSEGQ